MDANEDVRAGAVVDMMSTVSMREAMLEKHPSKSPPATLNLNYSGQPTDGIWVTKGLEILRGGYTEFGGAAPSEHRGLWVDFRPMKEGGLGTGRLVTGRIYRVRVYFVFLLFYLLCNSVFCLETASFLPSHSSCVSFFDSRV
jgi:hypothetical protein